MKLSGAFGGFVVPINVNQELVANKVPFWGKGV